MEQLLFADIGATSYCGHQSNFVLRTNGTTFICGHRSNFILRTNGTTFIFGQYGTTSDFTSMDFPGIVCLKNVLLFLWVLIS